MRLIAAMIFVSTPAISQVTPTFSMDNSGNCRTLYVRDPPTSNNSPIDGTALTSLLSALASIGLVIDSTTP